MTGISSNLVAAMAAALSLLPSTAATPPQMIANVYRLAEAAALLTVCAASPAHKDLTKEKALELQALAARFGNLVLAVGRYYGDTQLLGSFEATRDRIAGESATKRYAQFKYKWCGDQLFVDMDKYVAENEKLLLEYIDRATGKAKPAAPEPKGR